MPELVACPSCGCKVQAAELLLGKRVRCIACSRVFLAGEEPPPVEAPGYPLQPDDEDASPVPPSQARGLARLRLPLCPRCHRPVGWEVPNCPHCGHLFEEDSTLPAPWPGRRDGEAHRGNLINTLGSVSLMAGTLGLCLPPLGHLIALGTGIPALVMARRDLERMRQGVLDPEGRLLTELGRNKSIVGVVLAVLCAVFCVLLIVHLHS